MTLSNSHNLQHLNFTTRKIISQKKIKDNGDEISKTACISSSAGVLMLHNNF